MDVPVVQHVRLSRIQKAQRTVQFPQMQYVVQKPTIHEKIVKVPPAQPGESLWRSRQGRKSVLFALTRHQPGSSCSVPSVKPTSEHEVPSIHGRHAPRSPPREAAGCGSK